MQQEPNNNPLWDVRLEMLKDYMYCHKGQHLTEIVQAEDKDKALIQALKINDMEPDTIDNEIVKCLGIRIWED